MRRPKHTNRQCLNLYYKTKMVGGIKQHNTTMHQNHIHLNVKYTLFQKQAYKCNMVKFKPNAKKK